VFEHEMVGLLQGSVVPTWYLFLRTSQITSKQWRCMYSGY